MNNSTFATAVDDVIKMKMEVVDEYINDIVDEIGDIGSPEKLIGKAYDLWDSSDLQRLAGVYGEGDDTPLAKLIFNKEYEKVKALETEA